MFKKPAFFIGWFNELISIKSSFILKFNSVSFLFKTKNLSKIKIGKLSSLTFFESIGFKKELKSSLEILDVIFKEK